MGRPDNPNNCATCKHKQNPDSGHCYMFRFEPAEMCAHHTMRSFFLKCGTPYLIGKLKTGIERRIGSKDDELLQQALRKHILERRREGVIKSDEARKLWDEAEYASFDGEYQELCQLVFGDEWWLSLPKEDNPDCIYLGKIVDTVKAAFSLEELQQKEAA